MTFKRSVVLAALAFAIAAPASARSKSLTQRDLQEHACYNDAMRLCKEFVPDEGKIQACMEGKKQSLSPECAALFTSNR